MTMVKFYLFVEGSVENGFWWKVHVYNYIKSVKKVILSIKD